MMAQSDGDVPMMALPGFDALQKLNRFLASTSNI